MEHALVFAALLALSVLYALARGGAPERLAALAYLAAYVATLAIALHKHDAFHSMEWGVLSVDLVLAAALLALALRANRYWTLWAASIQIVGIAAHLAKLLVPEILAPAYAVTLIVWSYAAIPLLIGGSLRHRQRLSNGGFDTGWSPL